MLHAQIPELREVACMQANHYRILLLHFQHLSLHYAASYSQDIRYQ